MNIPGTKIKIIEENIKKLNNYNYLVLFSWHIKDDLINILNKKGFKGKYIVPLPKPKIL